MPFNTIWDFRVTVRYFWIHTDYRIKRSYHGILTTHAPEVDNINKKIDILETVPTIKR